MPKQISETIQMLRAVSNPHRAQILDWLLDPEANFPPQKDGDLVQDGVCVGFITDKAGLSQPTVTAHMRTLEAAGLVTSKKIKNWVFYKIRAAALLKIGQIFSDASEAAP
ncbi:ArsR/SmtB family transcription factor [Cognatishimia activa]|uniref:Helix-turn-helix domain protein n=1 Tax=Cognatishimia activa TaxID=1715691 RepID=A0A0P1IL99_9RHOB|nr:helix-turn-helix transcriptional regulator [Cognatishimia activa]MEE2944044.1 helix-turn-helix transcriptional regulator [Pseudomonadota bacterium]CUI55686.1 Helix-turn-helix domain protein [Cognatishimia activa]CUK24372.1 Helix-turn-helix domain protein [Cognatishimia activa]